MVVAEDEITLFFEGVVLFGGLLVPFDFPDELVELSFSTRVEVATMVSR